MFRVFCLACHFSLLGTTLHTHTQHTHTVWFYLPVTSLGLLSRIASLGLLVSHLFREFRVCVFLDVHSFALHVVFSTFFVYLFVCLFACFRDYLSRPRFCVAQHLKLQQVN